MATEPWDDPRITTYGIALLTRYPVVTWRVVDMGGSLGVSLHMQPLRMHRP